MVKNPNPIRPGHLRASRERFGLSQYRLGVLAGFTRHQQNAVSSAELGKSRNAEARVLATLKRLVEERRAAWWMVRHRAKQTAEDRARIERQEALWNALPDGPEKAALLDAMIDRCFDLMCTGDGSQCDAIAEWLPPDRVKAMFDAWEAWDQGKAPDDTTDPEVTQ